MCRASTTPRLDRFTQAETNLQTPKGLRMNTFASDDTLFESIGEASPGAIYKEMLDLDTDFLVGSKETDLVELAFLEALKKSGRRFESILEL
jgi:hypothetical protein